MKKKIFLTCLFFLCFQFKNFAQNKIQNRVKKDGNYYIQFNNTPFIIDTTQVTIKLVKERKIDKEYKINKKNKLGFIDLQIPLDTSFDKFIQKLTEDTDVEKIEYCVYGFYHDYIPNDDYLSSQWYLNKIGMYQAWDFTKGSSSIAIGVLDSGTDWSHGDLGLGNDSYQNIFLNTSENDWSDPNNPSSGNGIDDDNNGLIDDWKGWNYALNTNDTRTTNFHGTFVAGIISGKTNNNEGIAGIAGGDNGSGIKILPYCIGINSPNSGLVDDAIIEAVDNGVRVIQLSLSISQSSYVDDAIQYAINNGVVVVCSSGNESSSSVGYPASNTNVISVGATDQNDQRASFSNYGNDLDVVAPGTNIYSTTLYNSYTNSNGTSFSSPQISALAGLILCINPNLTSQEVRNILETTTDKGGGYTYTTTSGHPNGTWNSQVGYGRVNAMNAVFKALNLSISGNPAVCTSTTNIYTIQNYVNGFITSWSSSSNLTLSNPTNNSVSVTGNGLGNGTLTATFQNGQTLTKNIWIGHPSFNVQKTAQACGQVRLVTLTVTNNDTDPTHIYNYSFTNLPTGITYIQSSYNKFDFKIPSTYTSSYFTYSVTATLGCSTGTYGNYAMISSCPSTLKATATNDSTLFAVYPNPSNEIINISLVDENSAPITTSKITASLHDLNGTKKESVSVINNSASLNVSKYIKGIYILKIEIDNLTESHQVLIE